MNNSYEALILRSANGEIIWDGSTILSPKNGLIFVEVIPRKGIDIEWEPINNTPPIGDQFNDILIHQACYNTIMSIEHARLALIPYVLPQNIFFFFGESVEVLSSIPIIYPLNDKINKKHIKHMYRINANINCGKYKDYSNNVAIILCEIESAYFLKEIITSKKQQSRTYRDCQIMNWSEFHSVNDWFYYVDKTKLGEIDHNISLEEFKGLRDE